MTKSDHNNLFPFHTKRLIRIAFFFVGGRADDDKAQKITILSTTGNLVKLVSANITNGDGTFHTSSNQFTQLNMLQ